MTRTSKSPRIDWWRIHAEQLNNIWMAWRTKESDLGYCPNIWLSLDTLSNILNIIQQHNRKQYLDTLSNIFIGLRYLAASWIFVWLHLVLQRLIFKPHLLFYHQKKCGVSSDDCAVVPQTKGFISKPSTTGDIQWI